MTATHLSRREHPRGRRRRHGAPLVMPLVGLAGLVAGAVLFVAYALWPRWPEPPVAPNAPALPVTVAGIAFNVPPAAVRMPVQRRAGAHERIDLAFLWPSLAPPVAPAAPPGQPSAAAPPLERLFVTIMAAGDTLPPAERVRTIYPRYLVAEPAAGENGLAVLAFREGTPYRGEDLIYDAASPETFIVRCSRNGAGPTPGVCLYSRRIETADIVVRFRRDWLDDWRLVEGQIERLIKSLRPSAG